MKKILLALAILIGLSYLGLNLLGNPITKSAPEIRPASNIPQNTFGTPSVFLIPSLNVKTFVESVGMDKEGRMDVPKNVDNVAWYNLGSKPGDKGSAVIAGHFDKVTGDPAVFYNISKLKPGDKIEILDKENRKLVYVVEKKAAYDYNNFPLQEVFADSSAKRLNIITCNGTWDKDNKNYSKRLVVYSRLAD